MSSTAPATHWRTATTPAGPSDREGQRGGRRAELIGRGAACHQRDAGQPLGAESAVGEVGSRIEKSCRSLTGSSHTQNAWIESAIRSGYGSGTEAPALPGRDRRLGNLHRRRHRTRHLAGGGVAQPDGPRAGSRRPAAAPHQQDCHPDHGWACTSWPRPGRSSPRRTTWSPRRPPAIPGSASVTRGRPWAKHTREFQRRWADRYPDVELHLIRTNSATGGLAEGLCDIAVLRTRRRRASASPAPSWVMSGATAPSRLTIRGPDDAPSGCDEIPQRTRADRPAHRDHHPGPVASGRAASRSGKRATSTTGSRSSQRGGGIGITAEGTTAQYRRDGVVFRPLRDAPPIAVQMIWRRRPASLDSRGDRAADRARTGPRRNTETASPGARLASFEGPALTVVGLAEVRGTGPGAAPSRGNGRPGPGSRRPAAPGGSRHAGWARPPAGPAPGRSRS